jgi:hypothetical protein
MDRRSKPNTTEAGYGWEHQKLRAEWEPKVARGDVACRRCQRLIAPGTEWHLGHFDDRSLPPEPEHAKCNLRTKTHQAARRAAQATGNAPQRPPGVPAYYEWAAGRWRSKFRSRDW